MNTHILTMLVSACILTFPSSVRAQKDKKNGTRTPASAAKITGPSLDETLTWLTAKIKDHASYHQESGSKLVTSVRDYKVSEIRFDGCDMKLQTVSTSYFKDPFSKPGDGSVTAVDYKVALADLDAAQVDVLKISTYTGMRIKTNGERKAIKHRFDWRSGTNNKVDEEPTNQFNLYFSDYAMSERIASAFRNAIRLCAAKKEPF